MTPLATFRQNYPQYDDMDDAALASALHSKFYSDIPKADFEAKIGLDPVAGIDFTQDRDTVRTAVGKLPAEHRDRALKTWAETTVAKEQSEQGVGGQISDAVTRFSSSVPGVGAFLDELEAGTQAGIHTLTGGYAGAPYDEAKAYQDARLAHIANEDIGPSVNLPVVGKVDAGDVADAAGLVGGAFAAPMLAPIKGAGAAAGAGNAALTGLAYGGAEGFGRGSGLGDRLERGALTAGGSAALAAPIGGILGRIAGKTAPENMAALNKTNDDIVAAQNLGIDLPVAATGPANSPKQFIAAGLKEVPFVGTPIVKAADKAYAQTQNAAARISDAYSPGATTVSAGDAAKDGIVSWIKTGSRDQLDELYEGVKKMVPAGLMRPLSATQKVAKTLEAEDIRAATMVNRQALQTVEDALSRPEGMTFEGLMALRTHVGNLIDDNLMPGAGTMKPALKRIYGALSNDLKQAALKGGGQKALTAYERAEATGRNFARQRADLEKIVGKTGDQSAEGVVGRLIQMAGTSNTANQKLLFQAKRVLPKEAWDEMAAVAVQRLGRNQSDEFSLPIFLKQYSALSANGKNVLFSSGTKDLTSSLDDLAKAIEANQNLFNLRNTSGTARTAMIGGLVGGSAGYMLPAIAPVVIVKGLGARLLAQALAKPAAVKELSRFTKVMSKAAQGTASQSALRFSILQLANKIADATGEREEDIAARIEAAINEQRVGRSGGL